MSFTQADLDAIDAKIAELKVARFSEGPLSVDTVSELDGLIKQREVIARSLRGSQGNVFIHVARRGYKGNEGDV